MIAVDQTVFGKPHGNCLTACIASLLHLQLADVPTFNVGWEQALSDWLRPRGWTYLLIDGPPPEMLGDAFTIVSGPSPRGAWLHSTVWRGRGLVHDPHPDRTGLVSATDTIVLLPLDPQLSALQPTEAEAGCTGLVAVWCPLHGTCNCLKYEDGERDEYDNASCPLHGPSSTHAEVARG